MKKLPTLKLITLFVVLLGTLNCKAQTPIKVSEVAPWCIIGFDTEDRNPHERIELLKEMGFTKYGYNRGKGEFETMEQEFQLATENNIEITSVFLYLNAKRDSLGKLSPSNQKLVNTLERTEQKPTIWVSFNNNYFEGLSQKESVKRAVKMINFVKEQSSATRCKLALYNHRGWFGDPLNQLHVLKKLRDKSITMVFNFHHGRETVENFEEVAKKITPHLSHVNISGVNLEGEEIVTLGQGEHEIQMVKELLANGYKGSWGILGHVKTEDVQIVLDRNLDGLELLNAELKK